MVHAMNSNDPQCSVCGLHLHDLSATVYTAAGDLVCLACGTRAADAASEERAVEGGRERIGGLVGAVSALVTLGLFVYATHDMRTVYVEHGHVQESSDASWSVLASGIGLSVVAGFAGFILTWWILRRRKKH